MYLCCDCLTHVKDSEWNAHNCKQKEQRKMTREEALNILNDLDNRNKPINKNEQNWLWLKRLEALGLLKFDEPKKEVERLFEINANNVHWDGNKIYPNGLTKFNNKYGVVRLEEWPEGLVLWVDGEVRWKSWVDYYKKGDAATIDYYDGLRHEKQKQAGIIS